jgi:CIC family chloride channel protein
VVRRLGEVVTVGHRWSRRRDELRELATRSRHVVLHAAIVGVITGLLVAGFETVVVEIMLEHLLEMPLWLVAVAPIAGLVVAALALRWLGPDPTPATADEYLKTFHEPGHRLGVRAAAARLLAAISTLGTGGAMGLEGPSMYLGATVGTQVHERMPGATRGERRALLVAGAAAGVAAIFKAPATGAVFAIEVPYQDDVARGSLLPSLIGAATGYLGFAAVHGTGALIPVEGTFGFNGRDIVGALLLGVLAGLGARWFARGMREAKRYSTSTPLWRRIALNGTALVAVFVAVRAISGESLTVEPGYSVIEWALDPDRGIALLVAVLLLRCAATIFTIAGGGVGGVFIPLVVAGALAGRIVGGAVNELDLTLFVVIGIAAFLGAGYRVPLASVMFVAETTGRPSIVVPGLLAAVMAELMMGPSSVTNLQRAARV